MKGGPFSREKEGCIRKWQPGDLSSRLELKTQFLLLLLLLLLLHFSYGSNKDIVRSQRPRNDGKTKGYVLTAKKHGAIDDS